MKRMLFILLAISISILNAYSQKIITPADPEYYAMDREKYILRRLSYFSVQLSGFRKSSSIQYYPIYSCAISSNSGGDVQF